MVSQMYGWIDGRMDSVRMRCSFCCKSRWVDEWIDSVSLRYRKDGWMD